MTRHTIVHLTASTFFGGPERQMLGLARALPEDYRTVFVSFSEGGRCRAFLDEVARHGFPTTELSADTPHVFAAVRELAGLLRQCGARVVLCHGYKSILLGRFAARRCGIPAVAVSRGWTGENWKVRLYESLERLSLRGMDRVVAVSHGQAEKVRATGVPEGRLRVIPNAIRTDRFREANVAARQQLLAMFPTPPRRVIGAAGRLSPEKGFGMLIDAAGKLVSGDDSFGFVHFGDGPLRAALSEQIGRVGLRGRFVLAGYRTDLDSLIPAFDALALPSFTEGLPNVVLEAFAAGVPVVATAVGGTPEVIEDGLSGYLVPPGDPSSLADRLRDVLTSEATRQAMGRRGKERVERDYAFAGQAARYVDLFAELMGQRGAMTHAREGTKAGVPVA